MTSHGLDFLLLIGQARGGGSQTPSGPPPSGSPEASFLSLLQDFACQSDPAGTGELEGGSHLGKSMRNAHPDGSATADEDSTATGIPGNPGAQAEALPQSVERGTALHLHVGNSLPDAAPVASAATAGEVSTGTAKAPAVPDGKSAAPGAPNGKIPGTTVAQSVEARPTNTLLPVRSATATAAPASPAEGTLPHVATRSILKAGASTLPLASQAASAVAPGAMTLRMISGFGSMGASSPGVAAAIVQGSPADPLTVVPRQFGNVSTPGQSPAMLTGRMNAASPELQHILPVQAARGPGVAAPAASAALEPSAETATGRMNAVPDIRQGQPVPGVSGTGTIAPPPQAPGVGSIPFYIAVPGGPAAASAAVSDGRLPLVNMSQAVGLHHDPSGVSPEQELQARPRPTPAVSGEAGVAGSVAAAAPRQSIFAHAAPRGLSPDPARASVAPADKIAAASGNGGSGDTSARSGTGTAAAPSQATQLGTPAPFVQSTLAERPAPGETFASSLQQADADTEMMIRDVRHPAEAASPSGMHRASVDVPRHLVSAVLRQVQTAVLREGRGSDVGVREIRISLRPERLGHVDIRIEMKDDVSRAVIRAENPQALEILRSDVRTLEQSLRDIGHRFDGGIEFETRDDGRDGPGEEGTAGGNRDQSDRQQARGAQDDSRHGESGSAEGPAAVGHSEVNLVV